MIVCLERGADWLHFVLLMPFPSKNPLHLLPHLNSDWFYLAGMAYPGCPGKETVKRCGSSSSCFAR